MKLSLVAAAGLGAVLTSAAGAANVYMLSSGDPLTDNAAMAALTSRGHSVTLGVQYPDFSGGVGLAGFDTVYLQCNENWTAGVMPVAGQQQLVDWVNAGGRLVTSEWVVYYTYTTVGNKFGTLGQVIPAVQSFTYGKELATSYEMVTPDPAINAGLPTSFQFTLTYYVGTETFTTAKAGATTYYTTSNSPGSVGLAGWAQGSGSVYSFLSTCGPEQVGDTNFGRLFSNVMGETGGCYADCNGDGALTVADFGCFQTKFVVGDPYADCNNSGTLTVQDFGCFQTAFVSGCP